MSFNSIEVDTRLYLEESQLKIFICDNPSYHTKSLKISIIGVSILFICKSYMIELDLMRIVYSAIVHFIIRILYDFWWLVSNWIFENFTKKTQYFESYYMTMWKVFYGVKSCYILYNMMSGILTWINKIHLHFQN